MRRGQVGEVADPLVERVRGLEVVLRVGPVGPEQVVVEVVADLAGEQRLPGVLVAALGAGEALLVAVVDDRVAAREVHQLVREPVARRPLRVARVLVVADDHLADAAHVVVAEERRQLVDVGVGVGVPVVVLEEGLQRGVATTPGGEVAGRLLEREVQHRLDLVVGGEVRGVALGLVEDLAEHEELRLAVGLRVVDQARPELLPEGVVDVLHGVDAEAVDPEVLDPGAVDVDEPVDHLGVLGEQVVEAEEVAVLAVLAGEGRVAAVVVERAVVEPGRDLEVLLARLEHGRVGERRLRVELGEPAPPRVVAVVELLARGGAVGLGVLGDVGRARAFLVADDVRGVVGDDVEVDLHAAVVGGVDQGGQVLVAAEVRVDLGEVGDPVAVVARRGAVLELDRLVLEARGQPDGVGAQPLDVVELVEDALEVTTVVEPLAGGVEAGDQPVVAQTALVVRGVGVLEAVGHHEVEVLVGHRGAQRVRGARVAATVADMADLPTPAVVARVGLGRRAGHRGQRPEDQCGAEQGGGTRGGTSHEGLPDSTRTKSGT